MTRSSRPALAHEQPQQGTWSRSDSLLLTLAQVSLALIAVQFALAGFGAFTMDKTPKDNVYAAHVIVGVAIGLLTLLILATVLVSPGARTHTRTKWPAVTLAVLAIAVQTVLGEAGKTIPALGALHALNGLIIFVLVAWLTMTTTRRKATSDPAASHSSGSSPQAR
jgi:cytochrome b561